MSLNDITLVVSYSQGEKMEQNALNRLYSLIGQNLSSNGINLGILISFDPNDSEGLRLNLTSGSLIISMEAIV